MTGRMIVSALFLSVTTCIAQTQASADFPSTDEIQLVVTQAERSFAEYKTSVDQEAELPSAKNDPSGVEKDRALLAMASKIIEGLKKKPDVFNSVGGLLLLTTLDDASRNAALCSSSGISDIGELLESNTGNAARGYQILSTAQACISVSTQLYTVSESVSALLGRSMEAQNALNDKALETVNKCKAIIKASAGGGK